MKTNDVYNEKYYSILSYVFIFGFLVALKKHKSDFLMHNFKRGRNLNLLIIFWIVISMLGYRLCLIFNVLSLNTINIVFSLLNGFALFLILVYQLINIVRISKFKSNS